VAPRSEICVMQCAELCRSVLRSVQDALHIAQHVPCCTPYLFYSGTSYQVVRTSRAAAFALAESRGKGPGVRGSTHHALGLAHRQALHCRHYCPPPPSRCQTCRPLAVWTPPAEFLMRFVKSHCHVKTRVKVFKAITFPSFLQI